MFRKRGTAGPCGSSQETVVADSSVVTPEGEEITGTGRSGAKANEGSTTNVVVRGLTYHSSCRCSNWRPERERIGFERSSAQEMALAAQLNSSLTRDTGHHGQYGDAFL